VFVKFAATFSRQIQMTFQETWALSDTVRGQFTTRLRDYLFDELLRDTAEYSEDDWERNSHVYAALTRTIQWQWEANCPVAHTRLKFYVPEQVYRSQATLNAYVDENFQAVVDQIGPAVVGCQGIPEIRFCCVYIQLYFNADDGHATLLFFDIKRRLQWFFDPQDHQDHPSGWGSNYKAFSRRAYIDGFDVVPAEVIGFADANESLQNHFERHHPDQVGICGILCMLVLLGCVRFGYYNTREMSALIKAATPTAESKKTLIRKAVSWYDDVDRVNRWDPVKLFEMCMKALPGSSCSVYSQASHKLCSRKACRQGLARQLCWQHKHLLQNPFGGRKCNADA
jgi:hypothetical protein